MHYNILGESELNAYSHESISYVHMQIILAQPVSFKSEMMHVRSYHYLIYDTPPLHEHPYTPGPIVAINVVNSCYMSIQ